MCVIFFAQGSIVPASNWETSGTAKEKEGMRCKLHFLIPLVLFLNRLKATHSISVLLQHRQALLLDIISFCSSFPRSFPST
jgi:hypothetical protein